MVLGLASDNVKRNCKSYIYTWKFRLFKYCKLIPPTDQQYFFDCQEDNLPLNMLFSYPTENNKYCLDCKEEDSEPQYVINLPTYQQTLLTALQINGAHGVYATFDPETEHCVVNNCANVHIWNNLSDFILSTYSP